MESRFEIEREATQRKIAGLLERIAEVAGVVQADAVV
jgi:hypothetical protein